MDAEASRSEELGRECTRILREWGDCKNLSFRTLSLRRGGICFLLASRESRFLTPFGMTIQKRSRHRRKMTNQEMTNQEKTLGFVRSAYLSVHQRPTRFASIRVHSRLICPESPIRLSCAAMKIIHLRLLCCFFLCLASLAFGQNANNAKYDVI